MKCLPLPFTKPKPKKKKLIDYIVTNYIHIKLSLTRILYKTNYIFKLLSHKIVEKGRK